MPAHHFLHPTPLRRRELFKKVLALRDGGRLFDLGDTYLDGVFTGSVDRFVEICLRLDGARRVLDVGTGHGLLVTLLRALGHECCAVDIAPAVPLEFFRKQGIEFKSCNAEVDPLPYERNSFDAVVCCQVLEHFTHSHLPAVREMHRVLKPGGIIEMDVPNVACFRNVSRLLRGKNITWDYETSYLQAEPILHGGRSFYPDRHNREFTRQELETLLHTAGFSKVQVLFLKDRNYRMGWARLRSVGSALRDVVPRFRKSLMGLGVKAEGR